MGEDHDDLPVSRRQIFGQGANALAKSVGAWMAARGLVLPSAPATDDNHREAVNWLSEATSAARWVRGAHKTETSKPVEPSLYAGLAGELIFFLELAHATRDQELDKHSALLADRLAQQLGAIDDFGLYTGLAGVAWALQQYAERSNDTDARTAARLAWKRLEVGAKTTGSGVHWGGANDVISGTAGIGLTLLCATPYDDFEPMKLATRAGEHLIALGREREGGTMWRMEEHTERELPNFSHGTAGIAYFLARLFQATKRQEYLEAAEMGARYLASIAKREDGACRIYHSNPGDADLHYLGWCHGPCGTARLFALLSSLTGKPEYRGLLRECREAVHRSGVPEIRSPGYWNNEGVCCGTAGIGEFCLAMFRSTMDRESFLLAKQCGEAIVRRKTVDQQGSSWVHAEHRVRPDEKLAQAGYMQGASGIGSFLIHLHLQERGMSPAIKFPDDPF